MWLVGLLAVYCLTPGHAPSLLQTVDSKAPTPQAGAELSLQARVAYQRAVDEVYWRHTVWPEAGGAKPSLAEVMSPQATRAKVEDALRKSEALARLWRQEITGAMLQAELERMARHTKRPEILRELFSTLNNDPQLLAEVIARPLLVERLSRNYYAYDERFHGELRARAAEGLARHGAGADLRALGGDYSTLEYVKTTAGRGGATLTPAARGQTGGRGRVEVEEREFVSAVAAATQQTTEAVAPSVRRRGNVPLSLRQDEGRFFVTKVLAQTERRLKVATVQWPKPGFDAWWQRAKGDFDARAAATKAAYSLPAFPQAAPGADDTWTPMSALPVANGTAVWTGAEMLVWGGGTDSGSRYNPATDTWSPTSTINAPSSRGRHTAVWTGSEMIVWGGCNQSGSFCGESTGGRYDPRTDTWRPLSGTDAPRSRRDHTAVWTGAEMIVWGGCHPGYVGSCNRVGGGGGGAYNPATDTWRILNSLGAPEGRTQHRAVWTGAEMIVWGGVATNITNTGGRYNPATDSWLPTSLANAPSPRVEHTAVWAGSVMVVWGGRDGNGMAAFNTGGRYDPASDSWAATSLVNAPPPRIGHTAVWTGAEMIVWGGDLRFSLGATNTGGRYRPDTDTWTPTNQLNAPSPRAYHVAVWTGSLMIVWSTADNKTGGRYDPANDSWTPTDNRDSSPSVYNGVWTGAEMLVWGPNPGCLSGCAGVGGRYDPALDVWRPLNLAGAPRGPDRDRPITAVWTGREMIVWGMSGYDGGVSGEGGRYNPATDSWSPVTKTNAPVNRSYHTAVWTGSEMIVWGGEDNQGTILNSGGRYNPATDSWQTISTADAPAARYIHTAVWTGREMIVWGGVGGGSAHLNTGGRYDPATDSWQTTTTNNAPIPRRYHTAVWTGAEMLVWGGRAGDYNNDTEIYDTGGRYNPATDTWQTTNTFGAPLARFKHTSVWTGSLMIVWGGLAQTGGAQREVSTGARYDPAADAWTPTALLRAPSARSAHVALWTGSGMIVWGGDRSPYTGTETHGAIYHASGSAPPAPTPTPTPTPTLTPTPTPPPPPTTPPTSPVNVALAANGATASASSTLDAGRAAAAAINGDRRGVHWGTDPATGSGWHDSTNNTYPDWLEVTFPGARAIHEVGLFSVQDNFTSPAAPTATMTFTKYGVKGFQVNYWTGSAWQPVPGGAVASNDKVWAKLSFAPVTTTKIRVVVNSGMAGHSRVTEVEAWGVVSNAPPPKVNHALAANGATASASSTLDAGRSAQAAINGDRKGLHWGTDASTGSGWHDATNNTYPDWLEVTFPAARTLTEVNVFSLQDNVSAPQEPTEAMAFTKYGVIGFDVEYWTGSAWALVPGGAVAANNKVWRKVTFPPLTTARIRVLVRKGAGGYSRVVEVEAY